MAQNVDQFRVALIPRCEIKWPKGKQGLTTVQLFFVFFFLKMEFADWRKKYLQSDVQVTCFLYSRPCLHAIYHMIVSYA